MSKKSRRRNKKILGALAAGLGAMALMKRRRGEISSNRPSGLDAPMITDGADTVVEKAAPINNNTYRSRHIITDSAGNKVGGVNNRTVLRPPTNVIRPGNYSPPNYGVSNPRRSGGLKSGGIVKGVGKAKRGLGRAMTKGRK